MNKTHKAVIVDLNEDDEEEVILLINDSKIRCFIDYCPNNISIGEIHDVTLEMMLNDDYIIEEASPETPKIVMIDNSFSCYLSGKLVNDTFHTFTALPDEGIHYEHPSLNNHFIKIKVARINVSFQ